MKIYTRSGDDGSTGLFGGGRLPKNDVRVAAYGAVDELNAQLGVCRAAGQAAAIEAVLGRLQHEMFSLGAELASPGGAPAAAFQLADADVTRLEQEIDAFEQGLPPLKAFVLPGGSPAGAALHVARAVCRRAERDMVALAQTAPIRPEVLRYLNRVGDLLFVLARSANAASGQGDVPWEKER
ncbi:MAG: cob(I)yrinic acid a,c-diamide adenosyltransferase [Planctomycetota bacterium]|nr:MAG: cob(I)yrinic acid a,c-diamide adenosyltransferase [Planctomycetota bacterium]